MAIHADLMRPLDYRQLCRMGAEPPKLKFGQAFSYIEVPLRVMVTEELPCMASIA